MKCPKCDSVNVAPIIYGMPVFSDEVVKAVEEKKIILGGCEIINDRLSPDYGCNDCNYKWSLDLLSGKYIKKIRYKVTENGPEFIDMLKRWVYEIYPDGKCVMYTYQGTDNCYIEKNMNVTSKRSVIILYNRFQKLFGAPLWERNIQEVCVCDGCSFNLQITYDDERKRVINGDIGGGTIDTLMENYVTKVFGRR